MGELSEQNLIAELRGFADAHRVGSIRIDMDDVRTILALLDAARSEGPAPVSAPLDREGVARIIDPRAFKPTIFSGDPDWHPGDDNLRRINALTKADAILALSQQDQVGGPTESDPS